MGKNKKNKDNKDGGDKLEDLENGGDSDGLFKDKEKDKKDKDKKDKDKNKEKEKEKEKEKKKDKHEDEEDGENQNEQNNKENEREKNQTGYQEMECGRYLHFSPDAGSDKSDRRNHQCSFISCLLIRFFSSLAITIGIFSSMTLLVSSP